MVFPPKIIHMIWFGPYLPVQYELNMVSFASKNPDFRVIIYLDYNVEKFKQRFCRLKNIRVYHYSNMYQEFARRHAPAQVELNRRWLEAERFEEEGNFAAVSDIFRLDVLYYLGGYYFDTDIHCKRALMPVSVPHGMLINTHEDFIPESFFETEDSVAELINNIVIATPFAEAIQLARIKINENYIVYSDREARRAFFRERGSDPYGNKLKGSVINMSGPRIQADIVLAKPYCHIKQDQLVVPKAFHEALDIKCDNSWVPSCKAWVWGYHDQITTGFTKFQALYRKHQARKKLK